MNESVCLPAIKDVHIGFDPRRRRCLVRLITDKPSTRAQAAAVARAVLPCLGGAIELHVELTALEARAGDAECPCLDFTDSRVRAVLAALLSVLYGPRLRRRAERCLRRRQREIPEEPEDLVEQALFLLLVGELEWHGSFDRMLPTVSAAIGYLSLNPLRFEENVDSIDWDALAPEALKTDHQADHEAWRVLLREDAGAAVASLPRGQRVAVQGCCLEGESATVVAEAEGVATSTPQPTGAGQAYPSGGPGGVRTGCHAANRGGPARRPCRRFSGFVT